MPLINLGLTAPKIEPGILLSCLETVIPRDKIAQAIEKSKAQEQRKRTLPTHIVISLIWTLDKRKNMLA